MTYTGVANGYTDERSLKATGEDTGEFLEKYSYSSVSYTHLIALGTNDVSQGTTLYRTEAEVQNRCV